MAWEGSDRRNRLPADWKKIRRQILKRDGFACQWRTGPMSVCGETGNEVDHIRPGDDHSPANLRVLCNWHHKKKSSSEGGRASLAKRKANNSRFRRDEVHPGLLSE
jgi:5-methylcytosine-specific restriction enzyme A